MLVESCQLSQYTFSVFALPTDEFARGDDFVVAR